MLLKAYDLLLLFLHKNLFFTFFVTNTDHLFVRQLDPKIAIF